jgi:hypothetical protein
MKRTIMLGRSDIIIIYYNYYDTIYINYYDTYSYSYYYYYSITIICFKILIPLLQG